MTRHREIYDTLGSMLNVHDAGLLVIHDGWIGKTLGAPYLRSYQLQRTSSGGLDGHATFSTASAGSKRVQVKLSATRTKELLNTLGNVRLRELETEPRISLGSLDWDADYPHIEVAIYAPSNSMFGGCALLATCADNEAHVPWRVTVGDQQWWTDSKLIVRALKAQRAALRWDVLEGMKPEGARRWGPPSGRRARVGLNRLTN